MRLSENFTLAEYTVSETAALHGIDNIPTEAWLLNNLKRMAAVMEEIRLLTGSAIIVTSGYRCPALNARIPGSSDTSAHTAGLATDFIAPYYGVPYDVCRLIEPHLERLGIDQLIYEFQWSHIGLREGPARHQVMTQVPGRGYVAGIALRGSVA